VARTAAQTSCDMTRPEIEPELRPAFEPVLVAVFVAVPLLALIAAVPLAWGWGLGWHDVIIATAFYYISRLGISVGLHRYFTHGSSRQCAGLRSRWRLPGTWPSRGAGDHPGRRSPQAPQVQRQGR
jgi:stearoyl-CoA desaturase (Delta-9 desaturase)